MQTTKFYLPIPPNFSFNECLWFLNRNYDDCLHSINGKGVKKAVEVLGEPIVFSLTEKLNMLEAEIIFGEVNIENINFLKVYIINWLDLERDIGPFYHLLRQNEKLAYMAKSFFGLRLIGIESLFEALCWSIIGQQINLSFAYKLKRRLVEKYSSALEVNGEIFHIFPSPAALEKATVDDLKKMQFSGKKAEYIINLAKEFVSGNISKIKINVLPDFESKRNYLIKIRGIGAWTANYALMKSIKDLRAIPIGDVGLLNALSNHQLINSRSENEKITALFKNFEGWESYLVLYLWRSLAVKE